MCIYIYIYINAYIYIYTHIHTYIHTHTHKIVIMIIVIAAIIEAVSPLNFGQQSVKTGPSYPRGAAPRELAPMRSRSVV